jgi:hypothetical protein
MKIITEEVLVTTTGSDGSASGTANTPSIMGYLLDIYLDYHASAPATTDVTITHEDTGAPILTIANNATDGKYAPLLQGVDADGAAVDGVYISHSINSKITVAVAQADALSPCVTAHIRYVKE